MKFDEVTVSQELVSMKKVSSTTISKRREQSQPPMQLLRDLVLSVFAPRDLTASILAQ
jgi:hypothetical protein